MAIQISSPLESAANNIVKLGTFSRKSLTSMQTDYNSFVKFLDIESKVIENIKLPKKEEIKRLTNVNLSNSFGNSGNFLSNLINGSFDVAQFLGGMFPVKGRQGTPQKPTGVKPQKPTVTGNKLKFTGLRSVGIVNSIFAGLDFATGLAEGESVGKAAAGAGGSLAGSLLGGAIGQALIPVPGLGFVVGSMAGGFLGGWGADRVTELATGGSGGVSGKLKERLKTQEEKQKSSRNQKDTTGIISKFDESVSKFEDFVYKTFASVANAAAASVGSQEMMLDYGLDSNSIPDAPVLPGEVQEMEAEGGQNPSRYVSSPYGQRWGRLHAGVDYAITSGTPVSVIQPGKVTYARWNDGGYGYAVQIAHPGGASSFYGHLSKISVSEGQQIEPGTIIGNVGSTGRSTGPHVHFEIRKGSQKLEIPTNEGDKYFRFGGNVKVKQKNQGKAAGKPTAVLMAGTNDYNDPKKGAAGVKQAIKALQDKGYNVVVVPPSEVGQTAKVSKQVQQSATEMGATVRKGQYKPGATHLTKESADAIANQYKGATFVGDNNAQLIPGAKIASPGANASDIANQISNLVQAVKSKPGIGGAELDPKMLELYQQGLVDQMSEYPNYNQQQSSITFVPMYLGGNQGQPQQVPVFIPTGGGGGGGGMMVLPGPNRSDVVNSLMKTMLLTNLSGT